MNLGIVVFGTIVLIAALVQLATIRPWARIASRWVSSLGHRSPQDLEANVRLAGKLLAIALAVIGLLLVILGIAGGGIIEGATNVS